MSENPLVDLGELSKPATVLVEKISDAVGGIFKPYQIVRVAKAEAEAERIHAQSQIQVTDLHRRAMHRFLEEEAKKQTNMETITQQAIPLLQDESAPERIEEDWIVNFFDKSRIVSDGTMQQLWAAALAQEANTPNSVSKQTVNLLADLERVDAQMFQRLCGYVWEIGIPTVLVFDVQAPIYVQQGIHFNTLTHLESIGLVRFDNFSGFLRTHLEKRTTVSYMGKELELTFPAEADNKLQIGRALLTRAGVEIANICSPSPIPDFFEYVYDRWAEKSLVPKRSVGS